MNRSRLHSLLALNAALTRKVALTPREQVVLSYRAQGRTYKEIAAFLKIRACTVQFHVRSILKKTGTHSSAEAVFVCNQVSGPIQVASFQRAGIGRRLSA